MHYKIEGTIRRNKGRFIIFAVLWLFMTIVLVIPIAYSIHMAEIGGTFNFEELINRFVGSYTNFGETIRKFW